MGGQPVILHVGSMDKFMPPLIKLINAEFKFQDHQFWLADKKKRESKVKPGGNIFVAKRSFWGQLYAYMFLVIQLHRAKKIILHGMFNPRVLVVLTLCPWLLPKCYWVLWGGDYLYREYARRDWKYYLREPFHKFVKKRIKHLITYIPESVEIVKSWYGCKAEWHECLCYTSNVFVDEFRSIRSESPTEKKILVGNSATETNQHFEAFDIIAPFVNEHVKVYVPLSYGDEAYAQDVIEKGERQFGQQFFPIVDFIERQEYQDFLDDIDVVVFNHNRHQAMGTIINILGLGKTLYMNPSVASWSFLTRLGLDVYCIKSFNGVEARADVAKNRRIIKSYFALDNLISQWSDIFEK